MAKCNTKGRLFLRISKIKYYPGAFKIKRACENRPDQHYIFYNAKLTIGKLVIIYPLIY